MKRIGLGLALLAFPTAAMANVKVETSWNNRCNDNSNTMSIKGRNDNAFNADIRLCVKSKNGRWTCWVSNNVKPGAWTPKHWGYFVCASTGDYFWSSRRAGYTNTKFDDPPGYRPGY